MIISKTGFPENGIVFGKLLQIDKCYTCHPLVQQHRQERVGCRCLGHLKFESSGATSFRQACTGVCVWGAVRLTVPSHFF